MIRDYTKLLKSLLPVGKAITKEFGSFVHQFMQASGDELSRIEQRSYDLLIERDPRNTTELVTEHEEDYGITNPASTLAQRRLDLYAKQIAVGGLYPDYYVESAENIGYTIYIYEYGPFIVDLNRIGDAVGGLTNLFLFLVRSDAQGVKGAFDESFGMGFDMMLPMDPSWAQTRNAILTSLMELIDEIKPGHMMAFYDYYGVAFDRSFSLDFNAMPVNDDSIPVTQFNYEFSTDFAAIHEYDGIYLTGSFDHAFDLSFDAHHGHHFDIDSFDKNEFF